MTEEVPPDTSQAYNSAITWRKPGLKYSKNEVYLDVVERVNMVVSATGQLVSSEIVGALKMKTKLTGMPELRLGLNDKKFFEVSGRGKLPLRMTLNVFMEQLQRDAWLIWRISSSTNAFV